MHTPTESPNPIEMVADPAPIPGAPPATATARIVDRLLDMGMPEQNAFLVAAELRGLCADLAFEMAAEFLRRVLRSLGKTAAAEALQRVILGDGGESLREAAQRAGCSRVNVLKLEKDIRQRLGVNSVRQ